MNKNELEGIAKKVVGTVEEAAGKLTGDLGLQARGAVDHALGATQEKVAELEQKLAKIGKET